MSRRYAIAFADSSSGVERRATVSAAAALVTLIVILALPVLIGFGVAWKVSTEAQREHARYRTLEIERANYLAATEALARHIDSRNASNPALDTDSSALTNIVPEPASSSPGQSRPRPRSPATAVSLTTVAEESGTTQRSGSASASTTASQNGAGLTGDRGAALSPEREQLSEVLRALAADARFHMAESEARTEAAARGRQRVANAPPTHSPITEEPPVEPANPGQGGSAEPLPTLAAQTADAESSIRGVIAKYVSGLESRDVAALKRVWPSLGGNQEKALRTEFANARTVKALFHDPRITINDDTTTVTGLRSYGIETQDGQRLFTTTRTTITLRRIDGAWVIERVVHSQ